MAYCRKPLTDRSLIDRSLMERSYSDYLDCFVADRSIVDRSHTNHLIKYFEMPDRSSVDMTIFQVISPIILKY